MFEILSLFTKTTFLAFTGKPNESLVKSRQSNVATYQLPEVYAAIYPLPVPMKAEVTSPTKASGSGAIYSTNTGNAVIYSQLDSIYSTKNTYESLFSTKPWELYHSQPEHFPEKHPLKLLQDFNDNSLKTLSQPQGVKQPVTSPAVPHRSPERSVSPTQRTSTTSSSQGESEISNKVFFLKNKIVKYCNVLYLIST